MRLFKKKRDGIWYVEFEGGSFRSLKTRSERDAKSLFKALQLEHLAGRISEIRGESSTLLQEFYNRYDSWARDAREVKTYKADMLALRQLLDVAGSATRLDKLTQEHADLMVARCRKRGCTPGTINAYIRHLRTAFNKVVAWKLLPTSPFRNLGEVPKEKKAPTYLKGASVTGFLGGIADIDVRRILTAYIYSGRRRAELVKLDWADVAMDRDEYFVRRSKAHLSAWFPMHPMFRAVLESIPGDRTGRVFDRWSHPDTITHLAKDALSAAGYKDMTLHKMRHTFAVLLVDEGIDLNTVGSLLGHTDKRATELYAHVSDNRQRTAIRSIKAGPVDLIGEA